MVRYKFSKTEDQEFAQVLRHRIKSYFQDAKISNKGNQQMALKSVVILSIYLIPLPVYAADSTS